MSGPMCLWCKATDVRPGDYHPECTRKLIAFQQADYAVTGEVRRRRRPKGK